MPSEAQRFKLTEALAAVLFVALSLSSQSTAQQKARLSDTNAENLEQGREIKREMGAGDAHSYAIMLQVGEFVHIVVEQMGIDVVVAIQAPDGKPLREMDSINGKYGPESISIVADKAGTYVLQI